MLLRLVSIKTELADEVDLSVRALSLRRIRSTSPIAELESERSLPFDSEITGRRFDVTEPLLFLLGVSISGSGVGVRPRWEDTEPERDIRRTRFSWGVPAELVPRLASRTLRVSFSFSQYSVLYISQPSRKSGEKPFGRMTSLMCNPPGRNSSTSSSSSVASWPKGRGMECVRDDGDGVASG